MFRFTRLRWYIGVGGAADLVLNLEDQFAGVQVDDVLKAVLVVVALLRDEPAFLQEGVGAGEVGEVDRNVMAVVGRQLAIGRFPEAKLLLQPHADVRDGAVVVLDMRAGAPIISL